MGFNLGYVPTAAITCIRVQHHLAVGVVLVVGSRNGEVYLLLDEALPNHGSRLLGYISTGRGWTGAALPFGGIHCLG